LHWFDFQSPDCSGLDLKLRNKRAFLISFTRRPSDEDLAGYFKIVFDIRPDLGEDMAGKGQGIQSINLTD
jgi:hypothetical protein